MGSLVQEEYHQQFMLPNTPVFDFQLDQVLLWQLSRSPIPRPNFFIHPTSFFFDCCSTMRLAYMEGVDIKGSWKKYPSTVGDPVVHQNLFADNEIHLFPVGIEYHHSCFVIETPRSKKKSRRKLRVFHIDLDTHTGHQRSKLFTYLKEILRMAMVDKNNEFVEMLDMTDPNLIGRIYPTKGCMRNPNAALYIAQIVQGMLVCNTADFPDNPCETDYTYYDAFQCNAMRERVVNAIQTTASSAEYSTVLSQDFKVTRVTDMTKV